MFIHNHKKLYCCSVGFYVDKILNVEKSEVFSKMIRVSGLFKNIICLEFNPILPLRICKCLADNYCRLCAKSSAPPHGQSQRRLLLLSLVVCFVCKNDITSSTLIIYCCTVLIYNYELLLLLLLLLYQHFVLFNMHGGNAGPLYANNTHQTSPT